MSNEKLIFDTHAHYDDEAFDADREELLSILPKKGVCHVINAGASLKGCEDSIKLAEKYPYISAAVGLHPEHAATQDSNWLAKIESWIKHPKVVAIGEIGLDYHYEDACPREIQKNVFEQQLKLAVEYNLPVVVHDREAHKDTLELLQKYRPQGMVHCFSGSVETAREIIKLGMYLGLGGVVTFKNAKQSVEVAKNIPLDFLLSETDAPYMAPTPFRGKRCDSSLITLTASKIAEVRGITAKEVLSATRQNAARLFNINLEE